ncbi:hypothetical protein KPH14_006685 [Odynerus spinipes]|uniref:Uncharacterized protein n=1 Tax=Odynerus spinipes TaxID=1348599 RepID=A0AAD9VRF6_9HYME|nr:hypothetical protein KPH14_006685 [Odynerus spinipes]
MSVETNNDEVSVEELLEDICKITTKIKKELDTINDLVRENGDFSTAVMQTNEILLKIIEEKGIDVSLIGENQSQNSSSKSKND